jgi:hypothetical protein
VRQDASESWKDFRGKWMHHRAPGQTALTCSLWEVRVSICSPTVPRTNDLASNTFRGLPRCLVQLRSKTRFGTCQRAVSEFQLSRRWEIQLQDTMSDHGGAALGYPLPSSRNIQFDHDNTALECQLPSFQNTHSTMTLRRWHFSGQMQFSRQMHFRRQTHL